MSTLLEGELRRSRRRSKEMALAHVREPVTQAAVRPKLQKFLPLRHMKGPEVHVPPDTDTRRSVWPNKSKYSRPLRAPSAATMALVPPPLRQMAVWRFALENNTNKVILLRTSPPYQVVSW